MARRSPLLAVAALALSLCWLASVLGDAFLASAAPRREVLGAAAAAAAALGGLAPARADWQGEPIQAMQNLGPQIMGLKDAVAGGDIDTVAGKLAKFDLYSSGVFKNNAIKREKSSAATDKLAEAVEKKDVSGMKAAYAEFLKVTSMEEIFSLPPGRSYHLVTPTTSMATDEHHRRVWAQGVPP
eukprot:CAMPEP_0175372868 /NCGR_PEP_ID=MMETSP0095-20121207/22446_1 /TAXON_ID=311494 /ORGANISM="Alexandrium monilatum, Strain CCMP3105" /LENGTH=183 /DNA_ID=CAMNT_0016671063 /DNA_START=50 /DNA_END=599 /DNA_ORIENTATION=+